MPYIKEDARKELGRIRVPVNAGELNYYITTVCKRYLETNGEKYQTYNDIVGALEGCKLELYRRKIGPYEDIKIKENGDVF